MAHYDCHYCGVNGCFGECRTTDKLSDTVPTAVVPRSKPAIAPYKCPYCLASEGNSHARGCMEAAKKCEKIVSIPSEWLEPGTVQPIPKFPEPKPVKSDGGSSSYYEIEVRTKKGETFKCETGDIIRALVDNDFNLGNIVKACRRVSQALKGAGKEGVDPDYDLNKIIYFAQDLKDHVIR